MKLILFAILAAMAPQITAAEGQYEPKGDVLGMNLREFRAKYKRTIPGHNQAAPMCSDTSPKGLFVRLEVPDIGVVKCMQHYPFEERRDSISRKSVPPTTVANVPARIIYSFISPDPAATDDGVYSLFSIYSSFPSDQFSTVRDGLIGKYGSPSKRDLEVLQNRMGATFQGEVIEWSREGSSIRLKQFAGSRDTASLTIVEHKGMVEFGERRRAKRIEGGAKDL